MYRTMTRPQIVAAAVKQIPQYAEHASDVASEVEWALDMAQQELRDDPDADEASENAQAEREIASLAHDDDPEPGAFYGLTPPTDTDTDQTHA